MATLGDTTVTSLNVLNTITGNGSGITNLNGSNIATGTVPFARIPTGTGASQVAIGDHSHTLSIAVNSTTDSTNNPAITLAHNTKYTLTAGGKTFIFKMPADPADNDTKNTAGSSDVSTKIYLIGASSQADFAQTFSNSNVYTQSGIVYASDFITNSINLKTHVHTYTPKGTIDLGSNTTESGGVTYVQSISSTGASGSPTTRYLHPSTTNAAPHTHTHTYDKTTSITLTANSSTADGRIKYVEAQGTITGASYTPAGSVTLVGTRTTSGNGAAARRTLTITGSFSGTAATITPSLGTPTFKYLSAAPEYTSTNSGNNSGSAVAAITSLSANESSATGDITYLQSYSTSGGTTTATTRYFHPSFTGTEKKTAGPENAPAS